MILIDLIKGSVVKLRKLVSKTTNDEIERIPLTHAEIDKFDIIQNKYLKVMCGSQSMNYISDKTIYLRALKILKRVELEIDEKLFLIEILEKYCNIIYKEKNKI